MTSDNCLKRDWLIMALIVTTIISIAISTNFYYKWKYTDQQKFKKIEQDIGLIEDYLQDSIIKNSEL